MENMLKYELMKYRHRLLYYRVAPIYIRYIPQKRKQTYKFDHCSRDRIVAASLPLQVNTARANPIGAVLSWFLFFCNIMCFVMGFGQSDKNVGNIHIK